MKNMRLCLYITIFNLTSLNLVGNRLKNVNTEMDKNKSDHSILFEIKPNSYKTVL